MTKSILGGLQARYGTVVEEDLRRLLSSASEAPELAGMMAYQVGHVDEQMAPVADTTAKRFRPLLCLLSAASVGGNPLEAVRVAAAIELLHNFSLIHDDIEDRDPERRHRPTVWKVWGEAQGINAGDAMFALASRAVLEASTDPQTTLLLARRFEDTALALTEGQYLDMRFESALDVTPDSYLDMIAKKTGSLIDFSVWSGAKVGGANGATLEGLSRFAGEFGRAFQIQDDVSGIWAPRDQTGKEPGKDLHNGKKTLPVLLAFGQSDGREHTVLRAYMARAQEDITVVLAALDSTDARRQAEERAQMHLESAIHALHGIAIAREGRDQLEALARELVSQ